MLIDAHLDLAFNALGGGADNRLSLADVRASAYGRAGTERASTPTVSLPALRTADMRVVFGTIFVQAMTTTFDVAGPTYTNYDEANTQGWAQLQYYQQLAAEGEIRLIGSRDELESAIAGETPLPGLVPLMEGADPIRDMQELDSWYSAGLRIIGPAWSATRYSGGTGAPGPLTPDGRELMNAMSRVGLALDTSHLAEESFWEALRLFNGPVIASHSNCRAFVPTDRHLSDDMIRAIVERDGVIGMLLYNRFLDADWLPEHGKSLSLDAVVRHIEHICELAGNAKHVGIGSDFDGGFGMEAIPAELDSAADLPLLGAALRDSGWRDDEIAGVLGGNWARWLRNALPE